jgi:hypothetical protein
LNLLPQIFNYLQGRVVLHQEIESGFVFIYQTTDGRSDNLSEMGVHHELNRKVGNLFEYQGLVYFFLN